MPCVHPIRAWRNNFSDLRSRKRSAPFFHAPPKSSLTGGTVKEIRLPCGKCIECRIDYSRQWAIRGVCELQSVPSASFVTFTYNNENLPPDGSLVKDDYQKFLKRLRRAGYKFTYMLCGEYGAKLGRPHYHAIIFGEDFKKGSTLAPVEQSEDMPLFQNPLLTKIWGKGHVVFGDVSYASIQYVSKYVTKKITGPLAKDHYKGKMPEFMRMSLKTPIGSRWFDKFYSDLYPRDEFVLVVNDRATVMRPPKYFQKRYAKLFPDKALDLSVKREKVADEMSDQWPPERLAARKEITLAKFNQTIRRLERTLAA